MVSLARVAEYVRIPDEPLTDNFRLYEFLRSETAEVEKIDNTPNATQRRNILEYAEWLQAVRDRLRVRAGSEVLIHITSGFRSWRLNDALPNSSDTSAHLYGAAADWWASLDGVSIPPLDIIRMIDVSPLMYDQLIYYPGQPRIHAGLKWLGGRPRREVLTRTGPGEYAPGIVT